MLALSRRVDESLMFLIPDGKVAFLRVVDFIDKGAKVSFEWDAVALSFTLEIGSPFSMSVAGGGVISIAIADIGGGQVKFGIEAPRAVRVIRPELLKIPQERAAAAAI